MGFYGNITNTSRTQFVFDRTYSSRYEMDTKCSSDNVYAGRYVLVEYDTDASFDIYKQNYYFVDGVMYTQVNKCHNFFSGIIDSARVEVGEIKDGDIAWILADNFITEVNDETLYIKIIDASTFAFEYITEEEYLQFWREFDLDLPNPQEEGSIHGHIVNGRLANRDTNLLINGRNSGMCVAVPIGYKYNKGSADTYWMAHVSGANLTWTQVNSSSGTNYFLNFNIDFQRYGTSRGYDSTVWQKVYTSSPDATTGSPNRGRYEKYVMIAELNTVVPTFDITADPPSLVPTSPHFDANSTNVYYRFHWQPQWGIRTKAANPTYSGPEIYATGEKGTVPTVTLTTDKKQYPSDQKTQWHGNFYNNITNEHNDGYFDPVKKNWEGKDTDNTINFDAAIYYNGAGFDSVNITYSDDLTDPTKPSYSPGITAKGWRSQDKIALEPTGLSGNTYNAHDGTVDLKPQVDTQELSIMLPSIGDSISKMWDIVYGGRETNTLIAATNRRNKNLEWEDAALGIHRDGLRLVENIQDGVGYELAPAEVDTLAGCINSVHDLMGMIIVDDADTHINEDNLESVDSGAIYYYPLSGSFKRKHEGFEYTEVDYDYFACNPPLVKEDYMPGYYYLDANGENIATEAFNPNVTYYRKVIASRNNFYNPINLHNYTPGLYYKTLKGEWMCDHSESPKKDVQYYQFDHADTMNFGTGYAPYTLYYLTVNPNGNLYTLSVSEDDLTQAHRVFYNIADESITKITQNSNMVSDTGSYNAADGTYVFTDGTVGTLKYLYAGSNTPYFYYGQMRELAEPVTDPVTGETIYAVEDLILERRSISELSWNSDGTLNTDKQYYCVDAEASSDAETIYQYDEFGNLVPVTVITDKVTIKSKYAVTLIKFEANKYYTKGPTIDLPIDEYGVINHKTGSYQLLTPEMLNYWYIQQFFPIAGQDPVFKDFYTLTLSAQGTYYTKGEYWYKADDDSYLKDQSEIIIPGRQYYSDVYFTPLSDIYYVPGEYYSVDPETNDLKLDTRLDFDDNATYYKRNDLYVLDDTLNLLGRGAIWNQVADTVPASVKIATRTSKWEMIPLEGFARTLNTIHGLILRVNQLMEFNDLETRDTKTVQGALNNINDIIDKIRELNPRDIVIVDSYGRVHGSPWTTAQEFRTTNLQTSHSGETNENIYERIDLNSNLYVPNKYYYQNGGNMVLDTGTFITANREYWRKTENRWIYFDVNPDPLRPEIVLQHMFTPVSDTVTESDKNIILTAAQTTGGFVGNNNTVSDTLDLYTPIVDEKGHVVGKNTETVTLPFGFKTIQAENSTSTAAWAQTGGATGSTGESVLNIVADNTKDKLKFAGGNKWIRFMTSGDSTDTNSKSTGLDTNNILTIAHETHDITTTAIGATDLNNPALDTITIQDMQFDTAGHITHNQSHTYTLPYGFKTITTNGRGNSISENATGTPTTTNVVADNTQDTLAINSGNKWIRLDTSADNDSITIAHDIHTPTLANKAASDINGNGDTITIQDILFDEAGHMTANQNHTYTLPYSFKTIKVTNTASDVVTDAASTILDAGQIADNTQDILTFAASNKWIKLDNNTEDTIKIGHTVSTIATSTSTPTLSDESSSKTFDVPTYTYDVAGHITALATATYTLPNGYGKITDGTTTSSATATFDTFRVNGDNWLQATVTTDNITYTHKDANVVTAANVANVAPNFGESFTITDLVFDDKGHIYATGNGSHTVTIPQGSYSNSGNTGVITGLGFTASSGAITSTSDYLGAIQLGSYTAPTGSTNGITATSTLSNAISALDAKIVNASTSVAGLVQLNDTLTSTSTTQAATANAVKTLSDDVIHTNAEFTYTEYSVDDTDPTNPVLSDEETSKTITELLEKISSLEEEILKLKYNITN
ncbi:MAG: tail fiber protein [Bacilli bacterium]|nr:tail fiber protein [Bacilli bacterium]